MARITRKTQKVFAGSAVNNGVFGSAQVGTKVLSSDPDVIQGLAAWGNGWNAATISGQKLPTLEEMQGIQYVQTRQLAYILQEGVAEWDAGTEYHQFSVVRKTGTYELYGSVINTNTGNALPAAVTNANWAYLGSLASLAVNDSVAAPPRGTAANLRVQASSNTQVNITCDSIILRTAAGLSFESTSTSVNPQISVSGINGLDTGTVAADTWYYAYVVYNGIEAASLISASATSPTLPVGYTYFARVGAIRTNASSHLFRTLQYGNRAQYVVGTNPTSIRVVASGAAGDVNTPTYVSTAVGAFVPATAAAINLNNYSVSGTNACIVSPNASYGGFGSTANPPFYKNTSSTGNGEHFEILLESTNIFYAGQANAFVGCVGWTDNL